MLTNLPHGAMVHCVDVCLWGKHGEDMGVRRREHNLVILQEFSHRCPVFGIKFA